MRRLTILRPEPGASASLALAKSLGMDVVAAVPLFRIEPLEWTAPDAAGFDALLLTSANAVRCAGDKLMQLRGLQAYVVGEATAEQARRAGLDIAATGSAGVERLLGSIKAGQRLLHLCGEDRIECGDSRHRVTAIAVYRATELPAPGELAAVEVVAVHSPRAARRFADLAGDRSNISIAAISTVAADAAGDGWKEIAVAERPDDRTLLALARQLCEKPA